MLKLALNNATTTGTHNATTTNYSDVTGNSDEASGTNYTACGNNLDGATIAASGTTAYLDFTDEVFADVTVSADGCIIYNSSKANRAVAVVDFGGTVAATAGDLTIEFPAADASNAIIRIA